MYNRHPMRDDLYAVMDPKDSIKTLKFFCRLSRTTENVFIALWKTPLELMKYFLKIHLLLGYFSMSLTTQERKMWDWGSGRFHWRERLQTLNRTLHLSIAYSFQNPSMHLTLSSCVQLSTTIRKERALPEIEDPNMIFPWATSCMLSNVTRERG